MPGPRAPLARPRAFGARLQGVVPVASLHIHGADFEAMASCILEKLVGAVEAHGQAVQ